MSGALSTHRPGGRERQAHHTAPASRRRFGLRRAAWLAPALGLGLLSPRPASAAGLDGPLVGSGQSGPTAVDSAAVHWNPAQLAGIQRTELMLGGGLVLGHVSYERERRGTYQTPDTLQFKTPLDPANVDASKTGTAEEASTTPFAPVGDLFFAVPVLPDRLTVALGAYVPYAAALSFPDDGPQAWALRQAFIVASFVTASAGVKVNDKLSLGAGISYVGGIAELSKLQDFASLKEFHDGFSSEAINQDNDFGPDAPTEVRELSTLSRSISLKRAISHGISFNAGVAYRASKDVTFGFTYQHGAAMAYKGEFAIDMNDPFFTQDLAEQGLKYKPLVTGDATLRFSLPKRMTLGASYDASEKLHFDGFISYILYSDIDEFTVETSSPDLAQPKLGIGDTVKVTLPRNWNDTVWLEASARYQMSDSLLISGTLGYQSPASPDSTIDVASPDGHRILGGVGGVLKASDRVFLLGDLKLQGILPRTVTTSDHDLGNGTYNVFIATAGGHLKILF